MVTGNWQWAGQCLLMHLNNNQALKLNIKTVEGAEYLLIEAGGFAAKNGPAWKSRLIVFKRG